MKEVDKNTIPNAGQIKDLEKIELKNVLWKDAEGTKHKEDVTAEVIEFDDYNDQHVEFAYAHSDMLFKAPSIFKDVSEASRAYVKIFMAHKAEDEERKDSNFNKVYNDLRACRTLFNQDSIMKKLNDFFDNA